MFINDIGVVRADQYDPFGLSAKKGSMKRRPNDSTLAMEHVCHTALV